jgi:hypothetical protein
MLLLEIMPVGRAARVVLSFFLTGGAWSLASCGGAAPPAPAPVPLQPALSVPLPPPPDLSVAPEPAGLVLSGRIAKLSGMFATVRGWSNLPMPESEQVTELLTGQAVGALVDLDRPIDFAVASAGAGTHLQAEVAVSAAVKDVDAAKAALSDRYKLTPGDRGVLVIQGLGRSSGPGAAADDDDSDGDDHDHRVCELAPAYGPAPMRILCGVDAKALADLGPWLTRTATRATMTSDVHVDLRVRPLKAAISGLKRMVGVLAGGVIDGRSGASGVRDVAMNIAVDFVDWVLDLEGVSFDAMLSDAGAALTTKCTFSGSTSALTRIMTLHADGGSSTPGSFWQLPEDTDTATFYRGVDPNDLARLRDPVLAIIDGELASVGVKGADRKAFVDALVKLASPAAALYASGVDLGAVKKARGAAAALGASPERSQEVEAIRVQAEALLGWHFLVLDEPPTRFGSALKDLVNAWNRPGLRSAIQAKSSIGPWPALRQVPLPKGVTLPTDAQHYVLEVAFDPALSEPRPPPVAAGPGQRPPRIAKARPKSLVVHAFLAGDSQRTWLAIGGDEGLVSSKLGSALASGGQGRGRADLGFFKDARTGGAGFVTLRTGAVFAEQVALLFSQLGFGSASVDALDDLASVPNGGNTPIVYSLTAQPGGPPTSVVSLLQLPRGAIEDAVVAALRHGGF